MGSIHQLREAAPFVQSGPRALARSLVVDSARPVYSLATAALMVAATLSSLLGVVLPYPPLLPALDWAFAISGGLLLLSLIRDVRRS